MLRFLTRSETDLGITMSLSEAYNVARSFLQPKLSASNGGKGEDYENAIVKLPAELLYAAPCEGSNRHWITINLFTPSFILQPQLAILLVTRFDVPGLGIFTVATTEDKLLEDFEIPAELLDRERLCKLTRIRGLNLLWGAAARTATDHHLVFTRVLEKKDDDSIFAAFGKGVLLNAMLAQNKTLSSCSSIAAYLRANIEEYK